MSQYTWRIDFKIGYPESNENYFYVTFRQSREYLQMAEKETKIIPMKVPIKVTERVTENQSLILKGMKKDNQITARILSGIVGISERKIKENIKLLKYKGLLKRIGPARGGHWNVVDG